MTISAIGTVATISARIALRAGDARLAALSSFALRTLRALGSLRAFHALWTHLALRARDPLGTGRAVEDFDDARVTGIALLTLDALVSGFSSLAPFAGRPLEARESVEALRPLLTLRAGRTGLPVTPIAAIGTIAAREALWTLGTLRPDLALRPLDAVDPVAPVEPRWPLWTCRPWRAGLPLRTRLSLWPCGPGLRRQRELRGDCCRELGLRRSHGGYAGNSSMVAPSAVRTIRIIRGVSMRRASPCGG